jgi:hypothetical protein
MPKSDNVIFDAFVNKRTGIVLIFDEFYAIDVERCCPTVFDELTLEAMHVVCNFVSGKIGKYKSGYFGRKFTNDIKWALT